MTRDALSHSKKFANWCRLGGRPLAHLGQLVESQLIPFYTAQGFEQVSIYMRDRSHPLSAREIRLERLSGTVIDAIDFNFDKYHRPAFQLKVSRRNAVEPHAYIRSANIVRNRREYYHFWGKPWWLPTRFWLEKFSEQTVSNLAVLLKDTVVYIEKGQRNNNLSPEFSDMYNELLQRATGREG